MLRDNAIEERQGLVDFPFAEVHLGQSERRRGSARPDRERLFELRGGLIDLPLREVDGSQRDRSFVRERVCHVRLRGQSGFERGDRLVERLHFNIRAAELKLHAGLSRTKRGRLFELRHRIGGAAEPQVGQREVDPNLRQRGRLLDGGFKRQCGRSVVARRERGDASVELIGALRRRLRELEIEAAVGPGHQLHLVLHRLIAVFLDDHLIFDRLKPTAVEAAVLVALEGRFASTFEVSQPHGGPFERAAAIVGDRPLHDA